MRLQKERLLQEEKIIGMNTNGKVKAGKERNQVHGERQAGPKELGQKNQHIKAHSTSTRSPHCHRTSASLTKELYHHTRCGGETKSG